MATGIILVHSSGAKVINVPQSSMWYQLMGMGIVLSAALCSALADVYLEKMFKETKTISFWLRNASALTKDITLGSSIVLAGK